MKIIHEVNTSHNPNGIFDLCCDDDNCLLAYPELLSSTNHPNLNQSQISSDISDSELHSNIDSTHISRGRIGILDAFNLQIRTIIVAHDSPLHMISFNADGNYIASASQFGTLIRVFALPSGKHLYSFRRGSYPTHIECLAFNPSTTFLCCSSKNSNTIHIFNLNQKRYDMSKTTLNSTLNIMSDYIPVQLRNSIEHPRSFAHIVIKPMITESVDGEDGGGSVGSKVSDECVCDRIVCGFLNDYCIVVATHDGYFYRYSIPEKGGHCKLLSEHTLYHWSVMDDQKYAVTKIFVNEMNENVVERKVENVVERKVDGDGKENDNFKEAVDNIIKEIDEMGDESEEESEFESDDEYESVEIEEKSNDEILSDDEIIHDGNVDKINEIFDDQTHNLAIDCDLSASPFANNVNSNLNLMDLFDSLTDSDEEEEDDDGNETQSSVNES